MLPLNSAFAYLHTLYKKQRLLMAFTLVELLLVIVLMGIVASLSIVRFSHFFHNVQLQESSQHMLYLMRYAQSRAIMDKKEYLFYIDDNGYEIKQIEKNGGSSITIPLKGRLGHRFSIPEGISVESSVEEIHFFPDGKMTPAQIILHDDKGHYYEISTKEQVGYINLFRYWKL